MLSTLGVVILGFLAVIGFCTLIPIVLVKSFNRSQISKVYQQEINELKNKHDQEIKELNKKIEELSQALIESN